MKSLAFHYLKNSMARSRRNDEEWLALSAAFPGALGIQSERHHGCGEKRCSHTAKKALGGLPFFSLPTWLPPASTNHGRKGGNSKAPLWIINTSRMVSLRIYFKPPYPITGMSMEYTSLPLSILHLCGWSDCLTMSRSGPYPVASQKPIWIRVWKRMWVAHRSGFSENWA